MILFVLLLLFWACGVGLDLLIFSSASLRNLIEICPQWVPKNTSERAALLSLICAENVTESSLRAGLIDSGLIHLFVVSGSHLLLLLWLLEKIRIPEVLRWVFLSGYVALTGAQAPALRALIALVVPWGLRRWGGSLRSDQRILFAGLLTLAAVPAFLASRSLQLSWACALALGLVAGRGPLAAAATVHLVLWPFVAGWSAHPPVAILCNALLGPFLGWILFPAALATIVSDAAIPIFEILMRVLRWLLSNVPPAPPAGGDAALGVAQGWALLAGVHAIWHLWAVSRRRVT